MGIEKLKQKVQAKIHAAEDPAAAEKRSAAAKKAAATRKANKEAGKKTFGQGLVEAAQQASGWAKNGGRFPVACPKLHNNLLHGIGMTAIHLHLNPGHVVRMDQAG